LNQILCSYVFRMKCLRLHFFIITFDYRSPIREHEHLVLDDTISYVVVALHCIALLEFFEISTRTVF